MIYTAKEYKIYKFKWLTKKRKPNESFLMTKKENENVQKELEFKRDLINKFSPENFDELIKYTNMQILLGLGEKVQYKKSWLFDEYEIGCDMISEMLGVCFTNQWDSLYICVPKMQTEIIAWMDENIPDFVVIKKRV